MHEISSYLPIASIVSVNKEVKKVDIALSEYGEWPWQVSLRVREAPGNDGQAVLGDRQVRSTPQVMTCTSPVLKCLNFRLRSINRARKVGG